MKRPLIGIIPPQQNNNSDYWLYRGYSDAVFKAGGLPVIIPVHNDYNIVKCYLDKIKGLLLTGGVDPDPYYFQEEPIPELGHINPERDRFEVEFIKNALEVKKPILAICRGMQILNIVAGGNLYQDLNSQKKNILKHFQEAPRWYPTHKVNIDQNSLLFELFGDTIRVNSTHHQSIKNPAPGYKITAWAEDGVIEAIEKEGDTFVLGVQWHPERMWQKDEKMLKLFEKLITSIE